MSEAGSGTGSRGSGAPNGDRERTSAARPRSGGRGRKTSQARTADPAAAWQASTSWFDDRDVADGPDDLGADLVNVGFISAALRRGKRWWAGLAVLGLLLGVAVWAAAPATPQASTTLLLDVGPEGQPGTAILNDQVMAQSRGVTKAALRLLGLRQSVDSLHAAYAATVVTDRVLVITAGAPTSSEAVSRANAVASAFLAFRKDQLQQQQALQFVALDNVVARSERDLAAINARISRVTKEPASASQRAELASLGPTRDRAERALSVLKSQVDAAKAADEETTAAMVGKSVVLDRASPVPESRLKPLVLFCGAGLITGLFVGAGFVILRALVSDRLRRRDDIALALGAPVRLSIRAEPLSWWRRGRRGLAAARSRDVQRIVEFLHGTLPTGSRRAALAVVPVDDTGVAAMSVVSLAATLAQQDARVTVADLCSGAPAGRLLGIKNPGVHSAEVDGTQISLVIPGPEEIAPVGPFSLSAAPAQTESPGQLAQACASADVLLTLTTLDPSLASDHLRTWAQDAVVVVTAGRSSWTKIHAVGELVRLAGTRLVFAVLVGADKWDESLGVTASRADRDAAPANQGSADAKIFDDPTKPRFMRE